MDIYELGSEPGTKVIRQVEEDEPLPGCKLPACASAIEELFDWSINFNIDQGNPYQIFLDLIGFSDEKYGGPIFSGRKFHECLGYIELCLLGDALKVFENYGYDYVYDWCLALDKEFED